MATKNLGQVAGVHIGNTPPENTILIWFDNTPSQRCHKVYDDAKKTWVVLDQNIVSFITYSELVNIAKTVGLSIGKFFQIKDKGNALALAITTTKVQYDDELGNILIDDLGTNIQYHVTSQNLSIDDVRGVFNESNKTLVFSFDEQVPDFTVNDYIFGKVQRNNVWSLAKYRLSSFLSKVTGNSISWNGGFFFNFTAAIKGILDKKGGIVSFDTYDKDMQTVNQNIQNVGKANQNIIKNAKDYTDKVTTDEAIYNKLAPALETGGAPTDAAKGDKLVTVLSKFQRWITQFKYATGIKLSKSFAPSKTSGSINNNDTVESAFSKVQKSLNDLKSKEDGDGNFVLPDDWKAKEKVFQSISPKESYNDAFSKIEADRLRFINMETPLGSVDLSVGGSKLGTLNYQIRNGILEIELASYLEVSWRYFTTGINDFNRFLELEFNDNLFSKISAFLYGLNKEISVYRSFVLSHIYSTVQTTVYDNDIANWRGCDMLTLFDIGFGIGLGNDNISKKIGVIISPNFRTLSQYKSDLVPQQLMTTSNSYEQATLRNCSEGDGVRLVLRPFLLRYQLF